MSESQQTPLTDLLWKIPKSRRLSWQEFHQDGSSAGYHLCPIGKMAHEAADEITRLQSEVERLQGRCSELESRLQQFVISGTGPVADAQNKFQSALTLRKQAEAIEDSLSLYDPEWYARTLRNQADKLEQNQ